MSMKKNPKGRYMLITFLYLFTLKVHSSLRVKAIHLYEGLWNINIYLLQKPINDLFHPPRILPCQGVPLGGIGYSLYPSFLASYSTFLIMFFSRLYIMHKIWYPWSSCIRTSLPYVVTLVKTNRIFEIRYEMWPKGGVFTTCMVIQGKKFYLFRRISFSWNNCTNIV